MSTEIERQLLISPIVPECVQHNNRVLANIRTLAGTLFGVTAGILGLESYSGFIFYLVGSLFVSLLVHFVLAKGRPSDFFQAAVSDIWLGGGGVLGEGLSGFVLGWTGVGGVVRS